MPAGRDTLFDVEPVSSPYPGGNPEVPPLVFALLASETYRTRRRLVGRAALPDNRVAALLSALLAAQGRARIESVAADADIPAHRIHLTITALRRLLQVEGYPVLDVDPDGHTVILDERLLREQFHLGS